MVRITACSEMELWYRDMIGSDWLVLGENEDSYYLDDGDDCNILVFKCDCRTIRRNEIIKHKS